MDQTVKFSQNLTENSVNIRQFSWFKKVRKVRRTLKPNLEPPEPPFWPQKPNLEPTESEKTERTSEPNQVRSKSRCIHFANGWQWQTCYFFMVREKIQHRPELFEINVVTCNAITLLFGIEHYEKWLWGDFLGLNIMKNGYEVTFRNQTLQKMARMRMVSLLMCQSLASMLSSQ